jgi:phytoene dehydrogenase-like protein
MTKTAAVIGAGFGGLALAIRLQSAGIQTTVFENATSRAGAPTFTRMPASSSTAGRR